MRANVRLSRVLSGAASLAAAAFSVSLPASAQTVSDIHASLRELAATDAVDMSAAVHDLYRGLHEQSDRDGVEIIRDVRYGIFPVQTLDLYLPENRGVELLPVVVFVHGGNLDDGDKSAPGAEEFLFGNVATFFARHGFVAVNANYRLVPDIVWPQGAEDMREILGWLRTENAESYGGDPELMFMVSVSGGARHLTSYLFHRISQMVRSRTALIGAVLISPWLETGTEDVLREYYVDEQEHHSPFELLRTHDPDEPRVPVLLLSGELDPPQRQGSAMQMHEAMCGKYGDCPRLEQLNNHAGFSAVASFNTADESVSSIVLEFIREQLPQDASQSTQ